MADAVVRTKYEGVDNVTKVTKKVTDSMGGMEKSFNKLKKDVPGLGKAFDLISNPITIATAAIGAFAVVAKQSIGLASDMNETVSKVGVIFGEGADAIDKFSDTAAESLGQTKKQAMDAAATFATFGKAAGLSGDNLVDFSTSLTSLTSDLASFYNTSPEDAITAVGAALRGESEPIRRYGVLLDDATLRQQALKMGIISTVKEALTPQQRSLAAYQVILNQTKDAQGDFARTSNGLANQSKILTAQIEDLKTELGKGLTPAALAATKALTGLIGSTNTVTDRNELYHEALKKNIISEREWAQWINKRNPLHKDTEQIIEELQARLVEYERQVNATSDVEAIRAGIIKTEVIPAIEEQTQAEQNNEQAMKDMSLLLQGEVGKAYDDFTEKNAELTRKGEELRSKIGELESKSWLTDAQKQELADLRTELGENDLAIQKNKDEWDKATARIVFDMAVMRANADGMVTDMEYKLLTQLGGALGLFDDKTKTALDGVDKAFSALANGAGLTTTEKMLLGIIGNLKAIPGDYTADIYINTHGDIPQITVPSSSSTAGKPQPQSYHSGGDFIVPPGYNDNYPVNLDSGEHVTVTPAGSNAVTNHNNYTMNVYSNASVSTVTRDFNYMRSFPS